jgi:DNA-binding PadR family transcriptional regulator
MTMSKRFKRSTSSLGVLGLLYEKPMHPYMMQHLIKERGKDTIINMSPRASLYQTISQLEQAGFIRVKEIVREEKRPDRTVYELTDAGRQTLQAWLQEALSTPTREFPEFPAAISFLPLLSISDAIRCLDSRVDALKKKVSEIDEHFLQAKAMDLPRLFMIEDEYARIAVEAELNWVRTLLEDLRSGNLAWNEIWLQNYMTQDPDE